MIKEQNESQNIDRLRSAIPEHLVGSNSIGIHPPKLLRLITEYNTLIKRQSEITSLEA